MSGPDAGGLAVAILPILVSGFRKYDECYKPLVRYRHFQKEVSHFYYAFNNQRALYRDQCQILLRYVTDAKTASAMVKSSDHQFWSNFSIEANLSELFDENAEVVICTCKMINTHLEEINSRWANLWNILEPLHPPEDQMQNTLSRKRIFLEQLSFVISQRPLQKMIESLRISNEDFRSLCKGALELRRSPKIELLETDLATNQKFEEFSFINQASKQLYEVISDSCQQHEEHLTCFCTEVDQVFTPTGTVAQVKFRLGLVHSQSKTSPCWQNLAWFEIESASSDYEYSDGRVHETQQSSNFLGSLKSSAFDQSTARLKRTRRHPVPRSVIGGATSPGQSNIGPPSQTQDESINKDICKFIELDIKQPEKPSICCGFLKPSGSYKNRLYRVALQDCSMQSEAVSLKDLISQNRDGIFGRISPYDRVRLAQKLASAVLQFYSTPWLHGSLSSKDILFFGIHLVDVPKLTPPHFEVKIYSSKAKGKAAGSAFSTIKETINSILVNLGIVLLEIAHRSTCEELVRTLIASLPTGDRRSQKPIEELLASVPRHSDMGGSYHKIVNDILHGHICASEALGEGQLPSIIHQRVVIPLADVVHQVRTFHGG